MIEGAGDGVARTRPSARRRAGREVNFGSISESYITLTEGYKAAVGSPTEKFNTLQGRDRPAIPVSTIQ